MRENSLLYQISLYQVTTLHRSLYLAILSSLVTDALYLFFMCEPSRQVQERIIGGKKALLHDKLPIKRHSTTVKSQCKACSLSGGSLKMHINW